MILLYTDFGARGPYVGQMHAVLAAAAPGVAVIDLMHDAPAFAPVPAGYLLAALLDPLPAEAVILAVVDPGVGSARLPLVLRAGGRWFVGPDNGLLAPSWQRGGAEGQAKGRAETHAAWRIDWRPPALSASFHGRDLFAPVAAMLAQWAQPGSAALPATPMPRPIIGADGPPDLAEIIYIDAYGNALTGLRAAAVPPDAGLALGPHRFARARTFSAVAPGTAFTYENAHGLMEIAVNQGRADALDGVAIGARVAVI